MHNIICSTIFNMKSLLKHVLIPSLLILFLFFVSSCKSINHYVVTFETNGGTPIDAFSVAETTILLDQYVTEKKGYIFDKWYQDAELKTPWTFNTDQVLDDLKLYAKWIYPYQQLITPTYIHNFTTDGLTSDFFTFESGLLTDAIQSYTYRSIELTKAFMLINQAKIKITMTSELAMIHVVGYTTSTAFYREIWVKSNTSGTLMTFWYDPSIKASMLTEPELYTISRGEGDGDVGLMYIRIVEWGTPPELASDEHLVSLFPANNEVTSYMVVKHGEKLPELGGPLLEGYTFDGWYIYPNYQIPWDFNQVITEDVYLSAKFIKNPVS